MTAEVASLFELTARVLRRYIRDISDFGVGFPAHLVAEARVLDGCTATHLARIERNSQWQEAPELDHLWRRHCIEARYSETSQKTPSQGWRSHFWSEKARRAARLEAVAKKVKAIARRDEAHKQQRQAQFVKVKTGHDRKDCWNRMMPDAGRAAARMPVARSSSEGSTSSGSKPSQLQLLRSKHQAERAGVRKAVSQVTRYKSGSITAPALPVSRLATGQKKDGRIRQPQPMQAKQKPVIDRSGMKSQLALERPVPSTEQTSERKQKKLKRQTSDVEWLSAESVLSPRSPSALTAVGLSTRTKSNPGHISV